MSEEIVIVGAGGFAREVVDVVEAINAETHETRWRVRGVVDDDPSPANVQRLADRGVEFLGGTELLAAWAGRTSFVVGIGSPHVRRRMVERFESAGVDAATLVHPSVTRGFDVRIGAGSVICAGVRLTTNISLGRHVHLNLNSTVGHDTSLGDYVSVNPLASISGDCVIEDDVVIGVAGVILNGLTVGRGAVVGGSACVVKDVPPDMVVKGVPAR